MGLTRPTAGMINFSIHNVTDPLVRINSGQTGTNDKDVGFVFERGDDTNVALFWDETADQFVLVNTTEDGSTNGNAVISSYADLQVGTINTATLEIDGTAVTSTAAELNYMDGVTSNVQTQLDGKLSSGSATFTGTDGIVIPSGTTAQRPVSPATGTMRFNTTDGRFEGYNGTAWVPIDTLYS